MQKKHRVYLFSFVAMLALLVGAFGVGLTSAHSNSSAAQKFTFSSKHAVSHVVTMHTVNEAKIPASTPKGIKNHPTAMPLLMGHPKGSLSNVKNIPVLKNPLPETSNSPFTPPTTAKFQGMADSASICPYFGGCQPPDMAVAASTQWVLQSVNTSVAVYDTSGNIQSGWPKNSQMFYNVPNPPNNCDPAGPFLSDPRAFYDPNTGRFWVITLQIEGAFGIAPNCPFQSDFWAAVSQTNNPNGMWNVYEFDMTVGTTNGADYTQVGFDNHAFYFGANMFNQSGSAYEYDEVFGANKRLMQEGKKVTAYGFTNLTVGNVLIDTVQPVDGLFANNQGPGAGLFISAFNMNGDPNGNNCFSSPCSGLSVWAMNNPGMPSATLTGVYVPTSSYISPPNADEPGCSQCVETIDNRITATPPFAHGDISFSLDTAVQNNSQIVPAIFWGQVTPQFINGQLVGANLYQSGYFGFQGDQDASFGALLPDTAGNLIMVYDTMSSTLNPSAAYTARRVGYVLGSFHDAGKFLQKGIVPTTNSRWGDYEATSFDGAGHLWIADEYSGSNADWATAIGETVFRQK